ATITCTWRTSIPISMRTDDCWTSTANPRTGRAKWSSTLLVPANFLATAPSRSTPPKSGPPPRALFPEDGVINERGGMKRNPLRKTLPFPAEGRSAGVLLHITSLPSPYGIGDMGPTAFDWVNRLHDAGQRWWQALPLGPTGYGDSPYQSLSSFAGNGLLIPPESLVKDGLLHEIGLEAHRFSQGLIDYGTVIRFKHGLL